jgi:hypothetical protein
VLPFSLLIFTCISLFAIIDASRSTQSLDRIIYFVSQPHFLGVQMGLVTLRPGQRMSYDCIYDESI